MLFLQAAEIIPYLSLNFSGLSKLCLEFCCSVSTFHWNLCSFVLQIWLLFQFEGKTIFCYVWIMWFSLSGAPVILMLDFVLHIYCLLCDCFNLSSLSFCVSCDCLFVSNLIVSYISIFCTIYNSFISCVIMLFCISVFFINSEIFSSLLLSS